MNQHVRFNASYIANRGVHLERSANTDARLDGIYPCGDSDIRPRTETVGFSRSNMLMVSPNVK